MKGTSLLLRLLVSFLWFYLVSYDSSLCYQMFGYRLSWFEHRFWNFIYGRMMGAFFHFSLVSLLFVLISLNSVIFEYHTKVVGTARCPSCRGNPRVWFLPHCEPSWKHASRTAHSPWFGAPFWLFSFLLLCTDDYTQRLHRVWVSTFSVGFHNWQLSLGLLPIG